MTLENPRRAALRKLGHAMKPLMRVGNKGVTEAFVAELARSLKAHQLVKVRLDGEDADERRSQAEAIAASAEADVVDIVGAAALFYREDPENPLVKA